MGEDPTIIERKLLNEPYKAVLSWEAEGVKITVEAWHGTRPELTTDEEKAECYRRAKVIVEHFKIIMKLV